MESKRVMAQTGMRFCLTFNRTSMESKQNLIDAYTENVVCLLIEPVWNRNWHSITARLRIGQTFNRTSMESKHHQVLSANFMRAAFNRTSMESKPLGTDPHILRLPF